MLIGIIIGLFVGTFFGFMISGLLSMVSKSDIFEELALNVEELEKSNCLLDTFLKNN